MQRPQKQKKQKKLGKLDWSTEQSDPPSQDASLSTTKSTTPGSNMPPPSPSYLPSPAKASKVAIPRLPREIDSAGGSSTSGDQSRIAHACEPCRHRKTKCSGERPECKHCQDFKLDCVYVDGKRDRARKEFSNMSERLEEYERLLRDISIHADRTTKQRIINALQSEPSLVASEEPSDETAAFSPEVGESSATERNRIMREPTGPFGEDRFNARAGSLESVDTIDEDYDRDAKVRATGYYGKNSEITWMHRLRQRTEREQEEQKQEAEQENALDGDLPSSSFVQPGSKRPILGRPSAGLSSISSSTYHCDDLALSITNLAVNRYQTPPRELADLLLQSYIDTVHPSFPIVCSIKFVAEYKKFFSTQATATDSWLAILNMIFAISAKHAHLIRAEWAGPEGDHLVYFTRARLLGFTGDSILSHASIQHVQICGLIAFFLMSIHQINRSWALSGIAVRYATTLGLNLRNNSSDIDDFEKEMRCRTWWALCFLEQQLAVMTGRTPSFSDADCTCPQPFPIDEGSITTSQSFKLLSDERFGRHEMAVSTPPSVQSSGIVSPLDSESQSSSQHVGVRGTERYPPSIGLYFLYLTKLSNFTNDVLSRLYRVTNMDKSWADTQATIADLTDRLEKWCQELPLAFDFTKRMRDQHWAHQRKALGFLYHSTMLIINRPCLCRIDRKIPNESGRAKRFNQASAAKCVHAAIDMLNLLPDEPDPAGTYSQSPWWSLVHHLVEAAVVCMLELSFRADHMPYEVDEVFESADQAVQWLWNMANDDLAASRAWTMCNEMLRKVAPRVGKTVSDIFTSKQQLPDSMQGLQQSFTSQNQMPAFGSGEMQGFRDSIPFQPPVFTTYDQMMAQDPFLQSLLQTSTAGTYPNINPMAGDQELSRSYHGHRPPEEYYIDSNLEQQRQWHQEHSGGSGPNR